MAGRKAYVQQIKSSMLKRILSTPMLPENALNSYVETGQEYAGVYAITIPNETNVPIKVIEGHGIYEFGGIDTSSPEVSITKIIIDDVTVFDSIIAGGVLKNVFSGGTIQGELSSNTPPYLINNYITVYATNTQKSRGNNTEEVIYISLVPIE